MSFLGVQNLEFQYLFIFYLFFFWGGGGGFRKINIFGGMKILWIFFFWVITKLDYI